MLEMPDVPQEVPLGLSVQVVQQQQSSNVSALSVPFLICAQWPAAEMIIVAARLRLLGFDQ
jgi:hypothetical protein